MIKQHLFAISYARQFGPESQRQMKNPVMDELNEYYHNISKGMTYQNCLDGLERVIAEAEGEGKIPLLKDHPPFLVDSAEVQKMLLRYFDVPPKPVMVDHQLDVSLEKRNPGSGSTPYDNHLEEPFNPTVLPSRLMKTLAPVFIIRHPVRQVESWYRSFGRSFGISVEHAEFELAVSYRFSRKIYDYYKALYGQESSKNSESSGAVSGWPVVIDGDDVVKNPEGIAGKFCVLTGLDPDGVIYKWESSEWFDQGTLQDVFYGTLNKSEGVRTDLYPGEPDLAASSDKWRKDWGDEVANALIQYVRDAMTDYEYLHQFRI